MIKKITNPTVKNASPTVGDTGSRLFTSPLIKNFTSFTVLVLVPNIFVCRCFCKNKIKIKNPSNITTVRG